MITYKRVLLILIIIISGCTQGDGLFDPTYWSEPYSGITITDENGLIQKIDQDDWYWPFGENYEIGFAPAYPNPVEYDDQRITFIILVSQSQHVKLYVKDRKNKVIVTIVDRILPVGINHIPWDLIDNWGNKVSPDIYRSFIEAKNLIKHGDLWIK